MFTADNGDGSRGLWRSNGTAAGTTPVAKIPGLVGLNQAHLIAVGDRLVFLADDGIHGMEPWQSDGSEGGTRLARDVFPGSGSSFAFNNAWWTARARLGQSAFLALNDGEHGTEIWKLTPSTSSAELLKDANDRPASSDPWSLRAHNGNVFFRATDAEATGTELWKSDGTDIGTTLVADLVPGPRGSQPEVLMSALGKVFFSTGGLWATDGSVSGTTLLRPNMNVACCAVTKEVLVGGGFYDNDHGTEPWRSDGTPAGTRLLKDINPGPDWSLPREFTAVGNVVFFTAEEPAAGREVWRTDGTPEGTYLLKDIFPGAPGSEPEGLTAVDDTLFFVAAGPTTGLALWKSDGTEAGTVVVRPGWSQGESKALGGWLMFAAGSQLWKSDGTETGTVLVKDFYPSNGGPAGLTVVNGVLYFRVYDGSASGLWRSDGSEAGTVLVKVLDLGYSPQLVDANGRLFFVANDSVSGWELWTSDGTEAGTVMVTDIRPGPEGSYPRELVATPNRLFLTADDGTTGRELWAVDLDLIFSDGFESAMLPKQDLDGVVSELPTWCPAPDQGRLPQVLGGSMLGGHWH